MKVVEVNIDLFESCGDVFFDCTMLEAARYVEKHMRAPKHMPEYLRKHSDDPPRGVTLSNTGKSAHWVIWLQHSPRTRKGVDILSHEACHAAYRVMEHWGIDVDANGSELLATINGFIVKRVLKSFARPKHSKKKR